MGIQDRAWYREKPARTAGPAPGAAWRDLRRKATLWSVSTWLIVVCVMVYVLQHVMPLTVWGAFTAADAIRGGQVWRLLSFQFLHGSTMHLAFNMIGLWFFGSMVERRLGKARFLVYYLLCGCGGAIAYVLLWALGLLGTTAGTPLVGASAGLFGLIAAAMVLMPDRILQLALPPIDITVYRFGLVYLALAAYVVLFYGHAPSSNAGGEAAHLGGAAAGFLLARNLRWLDWVDRISPRFLQSVRRRRLSGKPKDSSSYMKYHGWR